MQSDELFFLPSSPRPLLFQTQQEWESLRITYLDKDSQRREPTGKGVAAL